MPYLSTLIVSLRFISQGDQAHTLVWSIYLNNGYNGEAAKEAEIKQAKDAIQTAVDAGVKHVVYSTLDGGHDVIHWDSKSEGKLIEPIRFLC